jgi:hypothetical protein
MQDVGDEGALRAVPLPGGWDEAVRLEDDPATIPDPAHVEVPAPLRAEIEAHVAKYPDRHSARRSACTAGARRRRYSRLPPSCR